MFKLVRQKVQNVKYVGKLQRNHAQERHAQNTIDD